MPSVAIEPDAGRFLKERRAYRAMAVLDITGATISAPAVDPMNP